LIATDVAAGLARVASCNSGETSQCVGAAEDHVLLFAGLAALLAALVIAHTAEGRPLSRATKLCTLIVLPVAVAIGDLVGETVLNPSDGAWDGRPIAIRLALLVVTPAALTLATGALNVSRWRPLMGLTAASVAISYVLPFAFIAVAIAVATLGSSWAGVVVLLALVLAAVAGLRRHARRRRSGSTCRMCP
jgi:hypothetical protein